MTRRCRFSVLLPLLAALFPIGAWASSAHQLYCSARAGTEWVNKTWDECWIADPESAGSYCLPDPAEPANPIDPPICCLPNAAEPERCHLANQPVLFVHGYDFTGGSNNFQRNWQKKHTWLSGECGGLTCKLPNFKETIEGNFVERDLTSGLSIEPYYIAFSDQEREIAMDAADISSAVERILERHGDPAATSVKVVIVGYSKGTMSSRLYLKTLPEGEPQTEPYRPVSEFVALSPANHGLAVTFDLGSTALCQLSDGYDDSCESLCEEGHNFIRCLNHPGETPGARPADSSRNRGVLYLSLFDPEDSVGGSGSFRVTGDCLEDAPAPQCPDASPSGNCILAAGQLPGRVRAENCGEYAVNQEVEVPDTREFVVHGNTVHTPEVICRALYAASHHHAPPEGLCCLDGTQPCGHEKVPTIPRDHPGLVLLLDVSGSMTNRVQGIEPPRTRLELARDAAELFLALLTEFGAGESHGGLAVFPSQPARGCTGQPIILTSLVTGETLIEGIDELGALSGDGNTPLLGGLEAAATMLGSEEKRAVLLLTDGHQNCPAVGPEELKDTEVVKRLQAAQIPVSSVGFGNHDSNFLQELASETEGEFRGVSDAEGAAPAALRAAFEQFLTDFLDLDQTGFTTGPIAGSQEVTGKTGLTPEERRVVFVLSWTTPEERRLQLEVLSSDGEKVLGLDGDPVASDAVRLIERSTFTILSVDEPFLNAPDKVSEDPWRTRIRLAGGGQETYRLGVLVDSGLKLDIGVTPPPLAAGDPLFLTARLTVEGEPVSEDVEVIAEVIRPEDGAGNWFATHAVSETELAEVPEELGDDLRARALRKSIYLTDIRGVALPARLAPTAVTLNDHGADSDEVSGDGVYTGRFTDTSKEGTYVFRVRATGFDAEGTRLFEREQTLHRYLGVRPTGTATTVKVAELGDADLGFRRFDLTVTPRDALGNHLGPRFATGIQVEISHVEGTPTLTDRLDGSYALTFAIEDTIDPRAVEITVDALGATQSFSLADKLPAWNLGLHLDRALPRGGLGSRVDNGYAAGLHLERSLSHHLSVLGLVGHRSFSNATSARTDVYRWNLSANLAYRFRRRGPDWYLAGGPGVYLPLSGPARFGANVEAGTYVFRSSEWSLRLAAAYHRVFTAGGDIDFLQAGVRVVRGF